MKLKHIDNNFYYLTAKQAKSLCVENTLPQPGYERKADFEKLKGVELIYKRYSLAFSSTQYKSAWVGRTPLSYWDGKYTPNGMAWALHLN